MSKPKQIKVVAIVGSIRPDNYTSKALNLVIDELTKYPEVYTERIDPREMNLNFPGKVADGSFQSLQKTVLDATGVILTTPEYHGSYSSVIKVIIENLGYPSVLAGKPIALLGVAGGQIGAIKALEHLRSVCSHIGGIVLLDVDISLQAAQFSLQLKIPMADSIILATARAYDATIWTQDTDFKELERVKFIKA